MDLGAAIDRLTDINLLYASTTFLKILSWSTKERFFSRMVMPAVAHLLKLADPTYSNFRLQ